MLVEDLFESYNRNSYEDSKSQSQSLCEKESGLETKMIVWNDAHEWQLYMLIKKRVEDEDVFVRTFKTSKKEAFQHYKDNFRRIFTACRKMQIDARLYQFKIQQDRLNNSLPYQLFIQDKAANSQSSSQLSIYQTEEAKSAEESVQMQNKVQSSSPTERIEHLLKLEKRTKIVSEESRWNQSDELILILLWKMGMIDTSVTSKMLSYSEKDIKAYLNKYNQELEQKFAKLILNFKFSPDEIRQLSNKNLTFLLQTYFQKQQEDQQQKKKTRSSSVAQAESNFPFDLCFSEIEWKTFKR